MNDLPEEMKDCGRIEKFSFRANAAGFQVFFEILAVAAQRFDEDRKKGVPEADCNYALRICCVYAETAMDQIREGFFTKEELNRVMSAIGFIIRKDPEFWNEFNKRHAGKAGLN